MRRRSADHRAISGPAVFVHGHDRACRDDVVAKSEGNRGAWALSIMRLARMPRSTFVSARYPRVCARRSKAFLQIRLKWDVVDPSLGFKAEAQVTST
jgi:hypothetical protein